jgi:hypothetical protein
MYWVVSSSVVSRRHQLLDEGPQVVSGAWIEAGGRLVQEEHRWAGDQTRTDIQTPAHPAGVGLHKSVGCVGERETLQHLGGAAAVFRLVEVVPESDQLEVLAAGQ